ncbi:hypothetical protein DICSQDRAFT_130335 [Dichomitus squalens LYAD-421 SS1]|uniref:Uncharacterized protein n=1 Tax=Dichomitus squalens (strain LYAD-421) TaxID=732165 RepID=R7SJR7_DICSQ|nr:uncharacterized protein DICSQDRAFT_130335 [Dichomitus squalens LYAD-421 SS1]EJF55975.1 hypothetical protein DICSQDRAFT_130335 [Dichomitus squalens LYAD-421 SS1]
MSQPSFSSLTSSFGAILIGTYFSLILYGGILHQTYRYFQTYPGDRLLLKLLSYVEGAEAAMIGAGSGTLILAMHTNWVFQDLTDPNTLVDRLTDQIYEGIVVALTQAFFVRRAYLCHTARWPICIAMSVNKGGAKAYFPVPVSQLHRSKLHTLTLDQVDHSLRSRYIHCCGFNTDRHTDPGSAAEQKRHEKVLAAPNNFIYVAMSFVATKPYDIYHGPSEVPANLPECDWNSLNTRKSLRTTSGNLHSTGTEIFGAGVILELHPHSGGPRGENAVAVELSDLPTSQEAKHEYKRQQYRAQSGFRQLDMRILTKHNGEEFGSTHEDASIVYMYEYCISSP